MKSDGILDDKSGNVLDNGEKSSVVDLRKRHARAWLLSGVERPVREPNKHDRRPFSIFPFTHKKSSGVNEGVAGDGGLNPSRVERNAANETLAVTESISKNAALRKSLLNASSVQSGLYRTGSVKKATVVTAADGSGNLTGTNPTYNSRKTRSTDEDVVVNILIHV
jgi:hypothetical protein